MSNSSGSDDKRGEDEAIEYGNTGGPESQEGGYLEGGWKGVDDPVDPIDEDYEEPAAIGKKNPIPVDDLDMTPMVDVTFLLLIFFMVTASFSIQKSIQQPPPKTDDPSTVPQQEELEKDYVLVLVDQNNTYYVTSREEDEIECPSDREMWTRVRESKTISNVGRMIIRAHVDSKHKKVISAYDAGRVAGIEDISIETTEEEL